MKTFKELFIEEAEDKKILPLSKIIKDGRIGTFIRFCAYVKEGEDVYFRDGKNFITNITSDEFNQYIKDNKDKFVKIYKSQPFKKAIIDKIGDDFSDGHNKDVPSQIRGWALAIIGASNVDDIVYYDAYKFYNDVTVDKKSDSWVTAQGANMTSVKADVVFEFNGKEYKEKFTISTSGYWNE